MRNRIYRLKLLVDENENFLKALKYTQDSYDSFFKNEVNVFIHVAFRIFYFVESFFKSEVLTIHNVFKNVFEKHSGLIYELAKLVRFEGSLGNNVAFDSSRNKKYDASVYAFLNYYKIENNSYKIENNRMYSVDDCSTSFHLVPHRCGSAAVLKTRFMWQKKQGGNYSECKFEKSPPIKGSLKNKWLDIELSICPAYDLELKGQRPLARLIAQLAMEIFLSEDVERMVVHTKSEVAWVLIDAGFMPKDQEGEVEFYKLKAKIEEARKKGQLFPEEENNYIFDLEIHKATVKDSSLNTVVKTIHNEPSTVLFSLNQQRATWEEIIQPNPITNNTKENPILPQYYAHDLSRYE